MERLCRLRFALYQYRLAYLRPARIHQQSRGYRLGTVAARRQCAHRFVEQRQHRLRQPNRTDLHIQLGHFDQYRKRIFGRDGGDFKRQRFLQRELHLVLWSLPFTLAPSGGSCSISATFLPTAAGSASGTVTLTDNASTSPQTISLSGTGVLTDLSAGFREGDFGLIGAIKMFMKRFSLSLFFALSLAIITPAQTHTLCPVDQNCTTTGNNTHNGTESFEGGITETWVVGTGGVTANTLVQTDTSVPSKIIAATTGVYGKAMGTVAAGGNIEIARYRTVPCVTDTGGATAGDLVIIGTGTVTDCKDSGQTSSASIPITSRIVGVFRSSATAGNTALVELAPARYGTGGTGGNEAGANGAVQIANSGALGASGNLFDTGTEFEVLEDTISKGSNPSFDIRSYGAVATFGNSNFPWAAYSGVSITGKTLTVASGQTSDFIIGEGVTVAHVGATNTMTTPALTSVTPSIQLGMMGTGFVTSGPTGSTSYSYEIVAIDNNGGYTAASSPVTITTGQATLGSNAAAISSAVRSGQTVTITTATNHGLPVGCSTSACGSVLVYSTADRSFVTWTAVASAGTATTFTYTDNLSTAAGASNGSLVTSGYVYWFNSNHLVLPSFGTNVRGYAIYKYNGTNYVFDGFSLPSFPSYAGNEPNYLSWDDWGQGALTPLWWLPTIAPTSAANDNLTTTITAINGSNNTMTLATSATNALGSTSYIADNAPAIAAAFAAANATGSPSQVYIPSVGNNNFVVNSYLSESGALLQCGNLTFADTFNFNGNWRGDLRAFQGGSSPSFSLQAHPTVSVMGYPGIYLPSSSIQMNGLSIVTPANSLGVFHATDSIPIGMFTDMTFVNSGGASDYTGILYYGWGPTTGGGGAGLTFKNVTFDAAGNQSDGITSRPMAIFKGAGEINLSNIIGNRSGFFIYPSEQGIEFTLDMQKELEGPIVPAVTYYQDGHIGCPGGFLDINGVIMDSSYEPAFDSIAGSSGCADVNMHENFSGARGYPMQQTLSVGLGGGPTVNAETITGGIHAYYDSNIIAPTGTLVTGTAAPVAPTCTTVTAGPPYAPSGTWYFSYQPLYPPNKNNGPLSAFSSGCTSDGATQQIALSIPSATPGAVGYQWYRGNYVGSAFGIYTTPTVKYGNWYGQYNGNGVAPTTGGPAGMQNGNLWATAIALGAATTTAGNTILSTTAPTISSGFNTSGYSVSSPTSTAAFTVTVGTGTATSSGVLSMPTATTGWNCFASSRSGASLVLETSESSSSVTLTNYSTPGTTANFASGALIQVSCFAY